MPHEETVRHAGTEISEGGAWLLDMAERAFLLVLLAWFLIRFLAEVMDHPYSALLVLSEGITAILVLIRKPGAPATSANAWFVAIVGTCAPLLVAAGGTALIPEAPGIIMLITGLCFSLSAKLFLNRSFGIVAANRGVKIAGPYRLVRHPMYLGYGVTHLGFLLLNFSVWNILVYTVTWTALILRIRAEEGVLSHDEEYVSYKSSVRFKLVPGLY